MNGDGALAILNPSMMEALDKLAANIAQSSLIPDSLRGKPRDVLVVLMTGAELGIQPMQAIRGISVIKGKPALSADLLVSLVKQRKDICEQLQLVKATPQVVTYRAKRAGEDPTEMSFTIEDAQRAGLTSSEMYKKWPLQMLRARCATMICRAVFPDVALGIYDVDSGELTEGKVEKDVSPPTRGAEAVRAALVKPAPSLIVDVKAGETEEAATARVALPPARPHEKLKEKELESKLDATRDWLMTAKPNDPRRGKAMMAMAELEAEVSLRERLTPAVGDPGPQEADFIPSEATT